MLVGDTSQLKRKGLNYFVPGLIIFMFMFISSVRNNCKSEGPKPLTFGQDTQLFAQGLQFFRIVYSISNHLV